MGFVPVDIQPKENEMPVFDEYHVHLREDLN